MLTTCGHCRKLVRRRGDEQPEHLYLGLVHTRVLIGERFLPACSEECADILRAGSVQARRNERRKEKRYGAGAM